MRSAFESCDPNRRLAFGYCEGARRAVGRRFVRKKRNRVPISFLVRVCGEVSSVVCGLDPDIAIHVSALRFGFEDFPSLKLSVEILSDEIADLMIAKDRPKMPMRIEWH